MPPSTRPVVILASAVIIGLLGCGRGNGGRPGGGGGSGGGEEDGDERGKASPREVIRGGEVATGAPWRTGERRLLTAEESKKVDPASFVVSPDGRHWAYAVEKLGGKVYVVDGIEHKTPYKKVFGARFSDDGKDFAFIGVIDEGNFPNHFKAAIDHNGKAFPIPHVSHFDVQPKKDTILAIGGGRVAYTQWDERPASGSYNWTLDLMADGARVTKSASSDKYFKVEHHRLAATVAGGKVRLVSPTTGGIAVDGKLAYKTADVVKQVVVSADGSAWAATLETEGAPKKESYVVVNAVDKKRFETVNSLVLTPDGKHFGYLAKLGKTYVVVDNNATQVNWSPTDSTSLKLGPDGSWVVLASNNRPITSGNAAWPNHFYKGAAAASADARHVAAIAAVTEKLGDSTIYREALLRDGREEARTSAFLGPPVWSPDGDSLAIVAVSGDGKSSHVIRDGKAGPAFDAILKHPVKKAPILEFSQDGKSLAYLVQDGLEAKVVINGRARGAYDLIGVGDTRIGFTPDGRVTYLARKADGSVWWVEELPPGAKDTTVRTPDTTSSGSAPLFDGTDLSKWLVGERGIWKVENKLLVARGKSRDSIQTTGDRFGDFEVRIVARTELGTDASVMVRGAWVCINNTMEGLRTGSIYPSTQTYAPPFHDSRIGLASATARNDEWFTLDILVSGDKIATRVNGKRVALADLPKDSPKTGVIKLWYSGRQTLELRRVEVREDATADEVASAGKPFTTDQQPVRAKPTLPEYKLAEGFEPLFDGKSLAGWSEVQVGREPGAAWKVKDGLLRYEGQGPAQIITEAEYTDYHVRMVARSTAGNRFSLFGRLDKARMGRGNSQRAYGYMARLEMDEKGNAREGALVRASGGSISSLSRFRPGFKAGEWFTLDWIVKGNTLTVRINGDEVASKSATGYPKGPIGLSATSSYSPFEVYRIDMKKLR